MRVLFLASYFPRPSKPLIGTWALEQARALAQLTDLRVVCFTPYIPSIFALLKRARPWVIVPPAHTWPPTTEGQKGVRTTYLKTLYYPIPPFKKVGHRNPEPQMAGAWRSVRGRLLAIVDEFQPAVIYGHHTAMNGYMAERIFRLRNIPFVITDHDYQEISDCGQLPKRKKMFDRIKTAASQNICVSRHMENETRRLFPNVCTTTVYNGINKIPADMLSQPRPEELRGKQVVLSVGMFAPRKGFPLLVEAFAQASQSQPNAVLRIVGDGEDRPAIEAMIRRHNLQGKVSLLGLQPQKQVFQEMAWADLFALVSWNEPFATVFIEAMGVGRPVITASDGGICDVVKDGVHGLVVPPKDAPAAARAIQALLSDEPRRRAMGEQGRALVETQLNWTANARRLIEFFEEARRGSQPDPGSL
jgi:glycosyltransferase involved in cell wall biosynthesis